MGRSIWAFAGVIVAVAAVGQYVHARSARLHGDKSGCVYIAGPTTNPSGSPAKVSVPFDDMADGICFARPAGWIAKPLQKTSDDSVYNFNDPKSSAVLHLDVPTMPYRPFAIPMWTVSMQYIGQLKKGDIPDAAADPAVDLSNIPTATARRVCCHGHSPAGLSVEDSAVLLVHDRRVFVLSVDSSATDAPKARAALDTAAATIQWTR
jgi:hypothetical protein